MSKFYFMSRHNIESTLLVSYGAVYDTNIRVMLGRKPLDITYSELSS